MHYKQEAHLFTTGILKLLEIKDADIRLSNLFQCQFAIDKAIHSGGASSAVIPLVALYYGGFLNLDIQNPNRIGQDIFVLSKGHAVATLASIYADLGYIQQSVLQNSRSLESILNGHPGPILPGIQIATGPMGQGLGVAQGFAMAGQQSPSFDVFALTGDGELQEGPIWEAVMYAGFKKVDNLCVLIDSNEGQLDVVNRLILPHKNLSANFESFGWKVMRADATKYDSVFHCLETFKNSPRDGRPTVIICEAFKGSGSLSKFLNKHKVAVPDPVLKIEIHLQEERRKDRVASFFSFYDTLSPSLQEQLQSAAFAMNLELGTIPGEGRKVQPRASKTYTLPAPPRDKRIKFAEDKLPKLSKSKAYAAHQVICEAMEIFALDRRVMSVDADLASTSGLEDGIGKIDQNRAFNVGVAEANMMLIGEAFACLGYNAWVSTFCPFFDWKVLRRIAVGHQERLEVMAQKNGWLTEGYGLDLTFLATAADFDTQTNGATHMGNDDALLFDALAHLKIITASCPQQLLAIMRWIMEGNKGLVYLRILRADAAVIYDSDFEFNYQKAYVIKSSPMDQMALVSSGRGVHEALAAAEILEKEGIRVRVVDMPSVDSEIVKDLILQGIPVFVAEQNNGFLWNALIRELTLKGLTINNQKIIAFNTRSEQGAIHFIHSGTYQQLIQHFKLDPDQLAHRIKGHLSKNSI